MSERNLKDVLAELKKRTEVYPHQVRYIRGETFEETAEKETAKLKEELEKKFEIFQGLLSTLEKSQKDVIEAIASINYYRLG